MATAFTRKGSRVSCTMESDERMLVRELLSQTRQLLEPEGDLTGDPVEDLMASIGKRADPAELADRDPALARLLPDGHRDDPEVAAEFRSLTEHGLRQRKSANLSTAIAAIDGQSGGDRLDLDLGQAQALLIALTDVRLALGERLGLRTDRDSEALQDELARAGSERASDPRVMTALYYDFLSWLQESLAGVLL
ncbi:DUF2017 domain-containing protein [Rudaeicoccus suwonensis]|uniref:Uncharacterized protein DUF2017 n=1 Tax=Rudaeicoccus suwonensis TaxID=657409 RepID=A0A561E9A6_9MICO|nr:DUF2017 domain-containing protein [Rudaeicoccus suwonensis]TWE12205.1 uncharacterized protein DUF2017 [Rudaeicoccus suwonensis]